jgi:hypothetical protein
VCSLFFAVLFFIFTHHTSLQNIQILKKTKFFRFLGYNKTMAILENFEAWVNFDDEESQISDESLALKMFKECICENCGCKDEQPK